MKILELLKKNATKTHKISGIKLKFSPVTWTDAREFQDLVEREGTEDQNKNIMLCFHVLDNFVTQEDGSKVVDTPDEVSAFPIAFCVEVIETFSRIMTGDNQEDDLKK
jgi:hypothetical protein